MEFSEIPPNNDDPLGEVPAEEKRPFISGDEMAKKRLEEAEGGEKKPEKAKMENDPLATYFKAYGDAEKQQAETQRQQRLEELRREILGK